MSTVLAVFLKKCTVVC